MTEVTGGQGVWSAVPMKTPEYVPDPVQPAEEEAHVPFATLEHLVAGAWGLECTCECKRCWTWDGKPPSSTGGHCLCPDCTDTMHDHSFRDRSKSGDDE